MADLPVLRAALGDLYVRHQKSQDIATTLGFRPIPNPINLAREGSATGDLLSGRISELYRVGEAALGSATAGLYVALVDEWDRRSSQRDPARRRLARALVEHQVQDGRWIAVMLDHRANGEPEAEFILPRRREGAAAGTTRATVDLKSPSRFHLELLRGLDATNAPGLAALSRQWSQSFSVEAVTRAFHGEFRDLRDQFVLELVRANTGHPALQGLDPKKDLGLLAFGTRQLGRLLFLWFLQQKRWLGAAPGNGSETYLLDLFRSHGGAGDGFFNDVLLPLFFDALGHSEHDAVHRSAEKTLGKVPFLGGGLFRPDRFEELLLGVDGSDRRGTRIAMPDSMFDPAHDREGRRTIFGFLAGYRFTTQESTPDDQSVDPDPELLGKVFENLYQEDDRHQTGAYYTPREIVHYMCRQVLDGYLRDQTGVTQDTLHWLRGEAIDWKVSEERLDPGMAEALHHALDTVTVLDPAVGSGAFLVGTMQEIVLLRRGLEHSQSFGDIDPASLEVAEWKRRAITQSLYGVDINPMAVEICKLRLWLSLVIDLQLEGDGKPIALPDLEFRILAGDSLVDRMGAEPFIQSLPDPRAAGFTPDMEILQKVNRLQHEVDGLKTRFGGEGVTPSEQRDYARRIRKAELEIARVQLDHARYWAQETVTAREKNPRTTKKALKEAKDHLAGLDRLSEGLKEGAPFQKPFLWPVNFHDIMERGGFDIVLANPPYVRQESLDAIDQESYAHGFKGVHAGTADLLVYFYERAIQLLRDGGQLAFITSNKYMRAAYGEGIRQLLPSRLQIGQVIDFGDLPIFTVAAYPAVVTGRKTPHPDASLPVAVADMVYPVRRKLTSDDLAVSHTNVRAVLEELPALLKQATVASYPQALLRKQGWILEDPALVRLFDRLMSQGTPLGEYVQGRMYYGIKTGLNEAFVIDQAKRDELVATDPRSAEVIKPWLRGRDIKRWKAEWAGLYVIFTRRGTDIERFPAVKAHLGQWRAKLEPKKTPGQRGPGRKPGDYQWFEIQDNVAYYEEFEQPKVIWPEFARRMRFSFDDTGAFVNNKCYVGAELPVWLMPLLNSQVTEFMLTVQTIQIRGAYLQLFDQYVRPLPLPCPAKAQQLELGRLGSALISAPRDLALERQAEQLARRAFGLSADDSRLLDRWFENRVGARSEEETEEDDD